MIEDLPQTAIQGGFSVSADQSRHVSQRRHALKRAVLLVITVLYLFSATPAWAWEGFFLYVLNGNTIRVFPKESDKEVNVQLYGVDTSKLEREGDEAMHLAYQEYIRPGDVVKVIPMTTYPFEKNGFTGYVVGLVSFEDTLVNAELIWRGLKQEQTFMGILADLSGNPFIKNSRSHHQPIKSRRPPQRPLFHVFPYLPFSLPG